MADGAGIALAFAVGAGLGLFYFGGLWLTLKRLPGSKHPALYALASFFARTVVVVAVVFLVARHSWQRIAACLVSFIAVRALLVHRLGPKPKLSEETEEPSGSE